MGKPARTLVLAVCSVSLVFYAVSLVSAAGPPTYTSYATLAPISGSGISAEFTLVEKGTVLKVTGTATGMDPMKHYHSLIYDSGSSPSGPNACIPSVLPPVGGLSFDQMQLGSWQPIGQTHAHIERDPQGPCVREAEGHQDALDPPPRPDWTGGVAGARLCGKRGSAVKTP